MTVQRGEVWLADLNPIRGSEQAGRRPVLIVQANIVNAATRTTVAVPFTTNQRSARFPTCVFVPAGEGGLALDSVALCNQIRVLDEDRLESKLGEVSDLILADVEAAILYTLDIAL